MKRHLVKAVRKPPNRAMSALAARTPKKRNLLTVVAVKMPRGMTAPKWSAAHSSTLRKASPGSPL